MKFLRAVFSWSFRSLAHRPLRSGLTIVEIAIAMALVLTVMGFYRGYRTALTRNIERLGYQVLVTAKGCPYEAATLILRGGVIPMYLDESVVAEIARDRDVAEVTRFFLGTEPDPETDRFRVYMGVDDRFLDLKPWISFQRGAWFQTPESDEVILGYNVADELRARLGDQVRIRKRSFTVQGILDRSGTQDDGLIFLPLGVAQKLFDKKGKVTGVGVRLKELDRLDSFGKRLYDLPSTQVITLTQVQRTILGFLRTARWLMSAVAIVGLLIAVVGILNTVLMAVLERLPDLGVIRAIGGRRRDVFLLVWGEAMLLTVAGVGAGVLLAFAAAGGCEMLLRHILPYTPAGRLVRVGFPEIWQAGIAILFLGLLGGLYPAFRAVTVRPIRSIREAI